MQNQNQNQKNKSSLLNLNLYVGIAIILAFVLYSCKKNDIEPNLSNCIQKRIKEFSKNPICNNSKVDEYLFNDTYVYVFEHGNCGNDLNALVLGSDCSELGFLGGISGNMIIQGTSFDKAKLIRTVWKK